MNSSSWKWILKRELRKNEPLNPLASSSAPSPSASERLEDIVNDISFLLSFPSPSPFLLPLSLPLSLSIFLSFCFILNTKRPRRYSLLFRFPSSFHFLPPPSSFPPQTSLLPTREKEINVLFIIIIGPFLYFFV